MYIKRAIGPTIRKISDSFKVMLVTGPRQVGKTTLLKNLAELTRKYVTLDDPNMSRLAKQEPALFIESFSPPVMVTRMEKKSIS